MEMSARSRSNSSFKSRAPPSLRNLPRLRMLESSPIVRDNQLQSRDVITQAPSPAVSGYAASVLFWDWGIVGSKLSALK
ncbi:hypothetical protein ACOMHN_042580 [Nucella lapillus]